MSEYRQSFVRLDTGFCFVTFAGESPDWDRIREAVASEFNCSPREVDLEEGTQADGEMECVEFLTVNGVRVAREGFSPCRNLTRSMNSPLRSPRPRP